MRHHLNLSLWPLVLAATRGRRKTNAFRSPEENCCRRHSSSCRRWASMTGSPKIRGEFGMAKRAVVGALSLVVALGTPSLQDI
jgi:hypothetical protein